MTLLPSSAGSAEQPPVVRERPLLPNIIAWLTAFALCAGYFCIVYAPHFADRKNHSADYNTLADAFVSGHTYLKMTPSAKLLSLPDPYDPRQNIGLVQRDLSLFNGRFYWYLGPVPALAEVCYKILFGKAAETLGDHVLVLQFLAILTFAVTGILLRARRTFFPDAPIILLPASILAIGLSLPITWLAGHPYLLESAIAGGQCFLLLGLFFAATALPPNKADWDRLALAGACWALACGCRISLAPAAGALALLTLWQIKPTGVFASAGPQKLLRRAALLAPLLTGAIAYAFYNHARFNSWTETGWTYQLSWMNHHSPAGNAMVASPRYIIPNLYRYLFELPAYGNAFPWLDLQQGSHGLVLAFKMPLQIALESLGGLCWSAPFVLFSTALLPARRKPQPIANHDIDPTRAPAFRWLTRSLFLGGIFALAPVLLGAGSTERYLADAAPCLLLLGALGAWKLHEGAAQSPRQRRTAIALIIAFSLLTALCGLALIAAQ